jgi:hypothetical protein
MVTRITAALFAAFGLVLAIWGTLSPPIRAAPGIDELDDLPEGGTSAAPPP